MNGKQLLVMTADADALAVMNSVLRRRLSLEIGEITFDVDRYPMKDSGIVQTGPELARLSRDKYEKLILLWDHHGSGWENRFSPEEAQNRPCERLESITWRDHCAGIALVPELEEWLWHNEASITAHFDIDDVQLNQWIVEHAAKRDRSVHEVMSQEPKELFEHIVLTKVRRTISPRDFERIAARASLRDWQRSPSFSALVHVLRQWFPMT